MPHFGGSPPNANRSPNPADGLASVANVELERIWSSMPEGGPRCPRCERVPNEPPTFRASLKPFVEIAGGGEQQRISGVATLSLRRATLQHAERQNHTAAGGRPAARVITAAPTPAPTSQHSSKVIHV